MAKPRHRTERRARGPEFPIQDRRALASLLEEVIKRRFSGNRSAAARSVGIPHSTLKRYHEKRGAGIRRETLLKLDRLLGAAGRKRLSDAVLTSASRGALEAYDDWLAAELSGISAGSRRTFHYALRTVSPGDDWKLDELTDHATVRGKRLEQVILSSLIRRFRDEWEPLDRVLRRRPHEEMRARLASLRVVAPLLDSDETAGIERSYAEMSKSELRAFIKAGVRREVILLDRDTDVRRAQAAARHDTVSDTDARRRGGEKVPW
jgi:hypothetical protein